MSMAEGMGELVTRIACDDTKRVVWIGGLEFVLYTR